MSPGLEPCDDCGHPYIAHDDKRCTLCDECEVRVVKVTPNEYSFDEEW